MGEDVNNIQRLLGKEYDQWAEETSRTLIRAMQRGESQQYLTAILQHAISDLQEPVSNALRAGIMRSASLATSGPLAGWEYSPKALKALAERIEKSDMYVERTLLPSISESVIKHIEGEGKFLDKIGIRAVLDIQASRMMEASGQAAIGETQKAALQGYQEDGKKVVPVRWELDTHAVHCKTDMMRGTFGCVQLAGTYMGGIDTLPTLPAANTTCGLDCMCHLSLSFDGGKTFKRYSS